MLGRMPGVLRVAIATYLLVLTLALLVGSWPLQGPVLIGFADDHGLHVGDLAVLLASSVAAVSLLAMKR